MMRHLVAMARMTMAAVAILGTLGGEANAQLFGFGRERRVVVSTPHGPPPAALVVEAPRVVLRPAFDPLRDGLARLRSKHDRSRRDGALALGRLGDPRAVPDLAWLLRNDRDRDVREASALALGSIGDARALNTLKIAAATDRNRRVRQAANHAHGKILFDAPVVTSSTVVETITPAPNAIVPAPPVEIELEPSGTVSGLRPSSPPAGGEVLRSTPLPAGELPSPLPPPASEIRRVPVPRGMDVPEPALEPEHAGELPPGPLSEPLPPLDPPQASG